MNSTRPIDHEFIDWKTSIEAYKLKLTLVWTLLDL